MKFFKPLSPLSPQCKWEFYAFFSPLPSKGRMYEKERYIQPFIKKKSSGIATPCDPLHCLKETNRAEFSKPAKKFVVADKKNPPTTP